MDRSFPAIQYGFLAHHFPLHQHRTWEIHLFTGGAGALVQDGVSWPVTVGSLTLSPPGHGHELTVDSALSFYFLQFEGGRDEATVLRRLVDRQTATGPLSVDHALVAEVGRLKAKLDSPHADRVVAGVYGFRAWLYDLAAGHQQTEADEVDRSLVWLRQNLDRRLALDDLAAVARLGRFAFSRKFKARTGLSPLAYVHRSKVEAAGFVLAGTDLSLAEVAARFGYSDEFHFGKVFRRWRGVAPGRWRRAILAEVNRERPSP